MAGFFFFHRTDRSLQSTFHSTNPSFMHPNRTEILHRARVAMTPEVFDSFESKLPTDGPFTDDIVMNAVWNAFGGVRQSVRLPSVEFLSPVLEFEVEAASVSVR